MALSLDDVPPGTHPDLVKELDKYFDLHGHIPPMRRWSIIFGPDLDLPNEHNRWMVR